MQTAACTAETIEVIMYTEFKRLLKEKIMRTFFIALSALISSVACGAPVHQDTRCDSELLGGDTVTFTVDSADVETEAIAAAVTAARSKNRDRDVAAYLSARAARDAIEHYIRLHTSFGMVCDIRRDLGIRPDPNGCRQVKSYSPFSEVCYLESNVGYFIAHLDYFGKYSVIFVRWD
jgi:hypothetical protein